MSDWKPGDIRTVQLGEHTFALPPIPKKEDILFYNLPVKDQYWRRQTDFPDEFYDYNPLTKINADITQYTDGILGSLNRKDTDILINLRERELKRRREGIWFMNKGEPRHLTGDHYFFLQWFKGFGVKNKFDNGSPYSGFRRFQGNTYYVIELCVQDNKSTGGYIVKPKKTGVSLMFAARELNQSTMTPDWNIGMMSNDQTTCKDTLFKYYKHGLYGLPYIFKPSTAKDNESKIEFGTPPAKNTGSKASQMRQMENGKGFNTTVYAAPTVADAFDGPVMHEVLLDELTKTEGPYAAEIFEKTAKTVKLGELLNGKLFIFNYVNEKDNKSFKEGRQIYYDSKLKTRDPFTGMTKSELYCYFISSADSMEWGDNQFDIYGDVDTHKNIQYIQSKRDSLKNNRQELQGYTRKFPLNEQECWTSGGGSDSILDNIRLGKRQIAIKERLDVSDFPYMMMNLEWEAGRLGKVKAIRMTEDDLLNHKPIKFKLYNLDTLTNGPLAGKFNVPFTEDIRDDYNRLKPRISTPFIMSTDPTDYMAKSDAGKGSKNAITAMTFSDMAINTYFGKRCTGGFFLTYLYRPENPNEYYEDLVKAILWLGCYIYVEANKPWIITKLKEEGLQNFILVKDTKTKTIVPYNEYEHKNQRLTHTTKDTIADMLRVAEVYFATPQTPDDFDMMDLLEDIDQIEQLMEFDKENTHVYDLGICSLSNIMAQESFLSHKLRLQDYENDYNAIQMQEAVRALIY